MKTVQRVTVPLEGTARFAWPEGSIPLSVQADDDGVSVWFMGDSNEPYSTRTLVIVGEGEPAPHEGEVDYLGPVVDGGSVHHIFLRRGRD